MTKRESARKGSDGRPRSFSLAIEGSTYEGSVALLVDSSVIAERAIRRQDGTVSPIGMGEQLMPAVAECLAEAGVKRGEIARIICGAGPGSFTSLRVAGSVAKGLASGYGVQLFAVSSLLLTVTGAKPPVAPGEYLSVLDAMRGEVFAARVVLPSGGAATQIEPTSILSAEQLSEAAARDRAVRIIGPGREVDARPHARGVAGLLPSILAGGQVDLALWEPDYGRLAEAQVRWEAAHGRPLVR
jgi:tRNA threonylcarbamoyladenosine biosynthesis protein TsaB